MTNSLMTRSYHGQKIQIYFKPAQFLHLMEITIKYVQYKNSKQNVSYYKKAVSVNRCFLLLYKHTLVRRKATEGVFTRHSCSFTRAEPPKLDHEDADDTDNDDDDKSRTHTQYILKYL